MSDIQFGRGDFEGVFDSDKAFVARSEARDTKVFRENGKLRIVADLRATTELFTSNDDAGTARTSDLFDYHESSDSLDSHEKISRVILRFNDSQGNSYIDSIDIDEDRELRFDSDRVSLTVREREYYKEDRIGALIESDAESEGFAIADLLSGSINDIQNLEIYFDSFNEREGRELSRGVRTEFGDATDIEASRMSLKAPGTKKLDIDLITGSRTSLGLGSFTLVDEDFTLPGDSFGYGAKVGAAPSIDVSVSTPRPKWYQQYQWLDYSRYAVNTQLGLNWNASSNLRMGASSLRDNYSFTPTITEKTFADLFNKGLVNGSVKAGVAMRISADVKTKKARDIRVGASQNLSLSARATTSGVSASASASPINWQKPTRDALTGLDWSLGVVPFVRLSLGVGAKLPVLGEKQILDFGPRFELPLLFNYKDLAGVDPQITASLQGQILGSATFFPFVKGGWTYRTPSIDLQKIEAGII